MPYPLSIGLILLAVLGLASSARAIDPIKWPLSKIAVEDGAALREALQAQRHSQDELDFALIAAAGKGRSKAVLLLVASGANPKRQAPPNGFSPVIVPSAKTRLRYSSCSWSTVATRMRQTE